MIDPWSEIERLREELAKRVSELEGALEELAKIRRRLGERGGRHMPQSPWASPEDAES